MPMLPTSWIAVAIVFFALMVAVINHTAQGVFDIYDDGTHVAQRNGLNLVSGTGITVTSADDPTNTRVNVTLAVTARSGTSTLTASATSTEVTHGLGSTPDQVLVSPTADTEGVRWWISTSTATTFTIEMNATTTANVTFDWRAQSEE